jgi:hypothetical protein
VTIAVSVTPDGTTTGNGNSYEARLSANGDVVAFRSEATNFIARGTSGYQVFARDLSAGARAATATKLVSVAPDNTTVGNDDSRTPSLSGNGGLVAFSSDASNLAPLDLNNSTDVFVRDISFAPFVSTPLPMSRFSKTPPTPTSTCASSQRRRGRRRPFLHRRHQLEPLTGCAHHQQRDRRANSRLPG